MKDHIYLQVDCSKIQIKKQENGIVIRVKGSFFHNTSTNTFPQVVLTQKQSLQKIQEQYSQLFKSEIVTKIAIPEPKPQASKQTIKSQAIQEQKPTQNQNTPNQPSNSGRQAPASQSNSFRRNIFSLAGQQNNSNQNSNQITSSIKRTNSFIANQQINNTSDGSSKRGNLFIGNSLPQSPGIFAQSSQSSSSGSNRDSRNSKTSRRIG